MRFSSPDILSIVEPFVDFPDIPLESFNSLASILLAVFFLKRCESKAYTGKQGCKSLNIKALHDGEHISKLQVFIICVPDTAVCMMYRRQYRILFFVLEESCLPLLFRKETNHSSIAFEFMERRSWFPNLGMR